jgi:hypothetical protein
MTQRSLQRFKICLWDAEKVSTAVQNCFFPCHKSLKSISKQCFDMARMSIQRSETCFCQYEKISTGFQKLVMRWWKTLERVSKFGFEMPKKDFYTGPKLVLAMMEKFQKCFKTEFWCGKKAFSDFQTGLQLYEKIWTGFKTGFVDEAQKATDVANWHCEYLDEFQNKTLTIWESLNRFQNWFLICWESLEKISKLVSDMAKSLFWGPNLIFNIMRKPWQGFKDWFRDATKFGTWIWNWHWHYEKSLLGCVLRCHKSLYLGPILVFDMPENSQKGFKTGFRHGKNIFYEAQSCFLTIWESLDRVPGLKQADKILRARL